MNEVSAKNIADALQGEHWHSGGNVWLAAVRRPDGVFVVFSDDLVCCYESQDAFENGHEPLATIALCCEAETPTQPRAISATSPEPRRV